MWHCSRQTTTITAYYGSGYWLTALDFHFLKVSYCLYAVFVLLFWSSPALWRVLLFSPFHPLFVQVPSCRCASPCAHRSVWGVLARPSWVVLVTRLAGWAQCQCLVYRPCWRCVFFLFSMKAGCGFTAMAPGCPPAGGTESLWSPPWHESSADLPCRCREYLLQAKSACVLALI